MPATLLAAALDYVRSGYRVIPCRPNTKIARLFNWPQDAFGSEEQVQEWWGQNPDDNIAFCPDHRGLAVLDIDPDYDEQALASLEITETVTVHSPRGGRHLHYLGEIRGTVGRLGRHIDTRGIDSYALLPPSQTPDGTYTWGECTTYAALPPAIASRLAQRLDPINKTELSRDTPGELERARTRLRDLTRQGSIAHARDHGGGGGDQRTYDLFAELVRDYGLSPETAVKLVEQSGWNDACIPPWSHDELVEKANRAERYGQNSPGAWAVDATPFDPPDVPSRDETLEGISGPVVQANRFIFKDAAQMQAEPEPEWIIPTLIAAGTIALLTAGKGSYKTFTALHLGEAIATGRPCFDLTPLSPGPVFYGSHEGLSALAKIHREAWCLENQVDPGTDHGFYLAEGPRLGLEGDFPAFASAIRARAGDRPVRLIVLDTYSACMSGADENKPQDVTRFIEHLREWLKLFPQAAVLVLAHTGKDEARGTRGSSALEAGTDTVLYLKRTGDHAELRVARQRSAPEREEAIHLKAKLVGKSMVLEAVDRHDLMAAKRQADPYSVAKIMRALDAAGAVTTATAVHTHDLARLLRPDPEGEQDQLLREAMLKEVAGELNKRAGHDIGYRGLTFDHGLKRRWYCPSIGERPPGSPAQEIPVSEAYRQLAPLL